LSVKAFSSPRASTSFFETTPMFQTSRFDRNGANGALSVKTTVLSSLAVMSSTEPSGAG
jgi:hypothetical protein